MKTETTIHQACVAHAKRGFNLMRLLKPLLLTTILLTIVTACSKQSEQQSPAAQVLPVETSAPIKAIITQWDEYTGRFEATQQVDIRARVSGYLDKVNFKDGQMVKKGDVLFVIDQRPFKIALQSAESQFALAKKELSRGKDLRKKNSLSQEEVDRRQNEYDIALANVETAKLDLEFTEVKSPIDGVVSRDLINEGNLVNGTATSASLLTNVVSIDPIHFYFDAGERDLLKYIRLSQSNKRESSRSASNPVKVRLQDEEDFVHSGVMDFVDNQIDQNTGTIVGRALLDNPGGFIVPGLFGRIRLLSELNVEKILIPDAVIGTDQSRKFVFVVNSEGKVDRKFVTLGKLHTKELRVIESGLTQDDRIILNNLMRARPGTQVQAEDVDLSSQYSL
ncbi:HlyD family transporter secretion protein [Paraglaciecola mesophila KMM 241]|uniref:HlyD family transporter secretion protein n=2 Tax=Paraglaciecola mesophila TaxID=197222 RepID=K6XPK2_9ALTE|nr:HlyD family transporter secretion protein [Paraglaciecola mesophila KMM 241]|tara:strand:- start:13978 stop:15156 length:1179 start_codon:yes stop_codon:yes gene_type:complete